MVRIFVSTHVIQRNRRDGTDDPAVIVVGADNVQRHYYGVEILGPARVVSTPQEGSGPTVWIETAAELRTVEARASARAVDGKPRTP